MKSLDKNVTDVEFTAQFYIQVVNKPEAGVKKSLSTKPQVISLYKCSCFSSTGVEKPFPILHNQFLLHSNYFAITGDRFSILV